MSVLYNLPEKKLTSETVITVGVFDGVHLGHQSLLKRLINTARINGWLSVVVTFKSHPETVLNSGKQLPWLDDIENRVKRIEDLGIDLVVVLDFTPELRRLEAQAFVTLLRNHLNLRNFIIGPDFAMGKDRQGTIETLRALGEQMDFLVDTVPSFVLNGEIVSSSLIRQVLAEGNIKKANRLLGRYFSYSGQVITGDGRGITLGFPTANLEIKPGLAVPADGIYATIVHFNNKAFQSVTNIGIAPTFDNKKHLIEAHLIDFNNNLTGKEIEVDFIDRLRDEKRFPSVEELKKQIAEDIRLAKISLTEIVKK
jgi:riboflavin kinase/FMN adenylyltransferase